MLTKGHLGRPHSVLIQGSGQRRPNTEVLWCRTKEQRPRAQRMAFLAVFVEGNLSLVLGNKQCRAEWMNFRLVVLFPRPGISKDHTISPQQHGLVPSSHTLLHARRLTFLLHVSMQLLAFTKGCILGATAGCSEESPT